MEDCRKRAIAFEPATPTTSRNPELDDGDACGGSAQDPSCAEDPKPYGKRSNMWRRHNLAALRRDGSVEFEGGLEAHNVDAVIYCTGYRYSMPFLEGSGLIDTSRNRVEPLYEEIAAFHSARFAARALQQVLGLLFG
eukprot:scaffold52099_cov35-Prasinocladus_malaysianus.AAC.1